MTNAPETSIAWDTNLYQSLRGRPWRRRWQRRLCLVSTPRPSQSSHIGPKVGSSSKLRDRGCNPPLGPGLKTWELNLKLHE